MILNLFRNSYSVALPVLWAMFAISGLFLGAAQAETIQNNTVIAANAGPLSSDAERIFSAARPRLLQVRTLLTDTGQQSSLGSAFLVSADGLAITNYHVVSQHALEPKTYHMEYISADGSRGALTLVAFDVVNDLAVVHIDQHNLPFFTFDMDAVAGHSLKGKRLYSMGNPLDLGFSIVEGTYNGLVDHDYNERIHFSGAINPGMSGGPAVTTSSAVVGINVAKQIGGELVSFLVPARFAVDLIQRAQKSPSIAVANVRNEISRQLNVWQNDLYTALAGEDWPLAPFGHYLAPVSKSPWFTCWSSTNAEDKPKPLAIENTSDCVLKTQLFLADAVNTGLIRYSHTYARSDALNAFRFATFLSKKYYLAASGYANAKYFTKRFCEENFLPGNQAQRRPLVKVVWCAQAYRDFDDIYDVSMLIIAQGNDKEALISRVLMQGVGYAHAVAFAQRFVGALQWNK